MDKNKEVQNLRAFVESGKDYLKKDRYDETLFYRYCKEGLFHLVEYMIDLKDINIFEMCNTTNSLYAAAFSGNIDIVKLLIARGYNTNKLINLRQMDGCTAFYCACQRDNIEIAQYLLDNGADIDIPDEEGNTSLQSAVIKGKFELFSFLLDRGANPLNQNNAGSSPFLFAQIAKRTKMREIMEAKIGFRIPKLPKQELTYMCDYCYKHSDSLFKCSSCLNAAYCNVECQKRGWKSHKVHCVAAVGK